MNHPMLTESGSIKPEYIVEGLEVIAHNGRRGVIRNVRPGDYDVPTYAIDWHHNPEVIDGYYPSSMAGAYIDQPWMLPVSVAEDLGWIPRER